jgi:hypothetical protein
MDYFVTVTPNYDSFWQIELLIQSFKMLHQQDRLLIGIVGSVDALPPNLLQHERKIYFSDYNSQFQRNHPAINKIVGIVAAQNNHLLDSHFVMMHSDMILVQPISEERNQNIVFHPHPVKQEIIKTMNLSPDMWLGFGGVAKFDSVPPKFFERVLLAAESLLNNYGPNWPAALAAWSVASQEYRQLLTFAGAYFEAGLTSTVLLPVIHYQNGYPPIFSKRTYNSIIRFAQEPYDCLLSFNPTFNTDYIQNVIRSYKNR